MEKMSTVAKSNYTTIEVAGREVRLSNPDKIFFPKPKFTKLDLVEYYIAVEDAAVNQLRERPGTMKRFVDGVERRVLLPEAGAEGRARTGCRPRPSPSRAAGPPPSWWPTTPPTWPGRSTSESSTSTRIRSGAATSTTPTSCESTSTRSRASAGTRCARWRCASRRCSSEHGLVGYPEDLGLARHPRQRPDRAALGLHRGPPGGAGARPRGRAPGAEERDQQVVEGGAPRRLRRLQPERARPDDRLGLLGAARPRRAGLLPARVGRGPRRRARRAAARHRARARRRRRATPRRTSTSTPARSTSCSTWPGATRRAASATPPGHPTSRKQRGEPKRVQPSRAKK